jgi:hypothetical protein
MEKDMYQEYVSTINEYIKVSQDVEERRNDIRALDYVKI